MIVSQVIANPPADSAAPSFRTADEWWESLGCVPMNRIVGGCESKSEYSVQSSETLIEIPATRLMLNRLAQA